MAKNQRSEGSGGRVFTSPLEWISAAIGLMLAIGMLGFIAWQAATGRESAPPVVSVSVIRVVSSPVGYTVELKARNHTQATAAALMIEGELKDGGSPVETSQATISYVPGYSERRAGLFFKRDPRKFQLDVRSLGYEVP